MFKIDYNLKTERLVRTSYLFKHLDSLPQLEKAPELYSNNQKTKEKLDQILGKLDQIELEPIFEDSGKYALYRNKSPYQILKDALSEAGFSPNKEDTYAVASGESFVEIENFTGVENISLNVLVKNEPQHNEFGLFKGHKPTESVVEIIVLN